MANELPATTTHVQPVDMLRAMRAAWQVALGAPGPQKAICTLVAQWALETGGGRACEAFNLGNFKAMPTGAFDYCFFSTTERVSLALAHAQIAVHGAALCSCDDVVDASGLATLVVHPPHPWSCFRAYPTLEAGCADYLHSMYTRFAGAWHAVYAGDPEAFGRALGMLGYYTSDREAYAAGCLRWFRVLMAEPWAADAPPADPGFKPLFKTLDDPPGDDEPKA